MSRRNTLQVVYYAPGIIAFLRILVTVWFLVKDPFGMPLRYLQVVPIAALLVALFMYFKLYSDGIPVITLMAPTILHFIAVFAFFKRVVVLPFAIIFLLDILFLTLKGIKANLFPFYIEDTSSEEARAIDAVFVDSE